MKAIAQYTITNLNDFSPSSSPPVNPYQGQVWQDTGVTPPKLRTWDGTKWVVSNDIEIGGRNLLKKSNVLYEDAAYNTAIYDFGNERLVDGETCTIQIKGQLGEGKLCFKLCNSSGWVRLTTVYPEAQKNGIYTKTFEWNVETANNTKLYIYAAPSATVVTSTIEWVKLERGNKATDWTPAPEDIVEVVSSQSTALSVVNGKITTLITESTTTKGDVTQLNNKYNSTIATVDGMNSIIGAHTTKLNTQTGQILEVQSKQTQFTTDLSGITARVTSVETNATAIGKTVTTHTTEISALKNQILLKVEQSDIDTTVSSYTKTEDLSAWISINKDIITSAVSATYATKSSVDGKADQSTVNTLSALITTQADKWTASFSVIGADGYTRTGKTEINSFGLTIYDGALTIKNKMGKDVLKADTMGNLNMVGNFTQYASNGNKAVEIVDNQLTIYNYGNGSRIGGEIGSLFMSEKGMTIIGHDGLFFANKPSNDLSPLAMSIGTDGSVYFGDYIEVTGALYAKSTLHAYGEIHAYSNMRVSGTAYFARQPILYSQEYLIVGDNLSSMMIRGLGASNAYLEIRSDAGCYGVAMWASDIVLKTNIAPSTVNALSKILAIEHASFDWRSDSKHQSLGVIANQLHQIEPSWVFGVEQPNGTQRLQVSEANLIPYITKSIQEVYQDVKSTQTITTDHTSELVRISTHLSDAEIEIIDLKAEVKLLRSMFEQKEVI